MLCEDACDSFAINVDFTDKCMDTNCSTHGCTCSVDKLEDKNIVKYEHLPLKLLMKSCSILRNVTLLEVYVK